MALLFPGQQAYAPALGTGLMGVLPAYQAGVGACVEALRVAGEGALADALLEGRAGPAEENAEELLARVQVRVSVQNAEGSASLGTWKAITNSIARIRCTPLLHR